MTRASLIKLAVVLALVLTTWNHLPWSTPLPWAGKGWPASGVVEAEEAADLEPTWTGEFTYPPPEEDLQGGPRTMHRTLGVVRMTHAELADVVIGVRRLIATFNDTRGVAALAAGDFEGYERLTLGAAQRSEGGESYMTDHNAASESSIERNVRDFVDQYSPRSVPRLVDLRYTFIGLATAPISGFRLVLSPQGSSYVLVHSRDDMPHTGDTWRGGFTTHFDDQFQALLPAGSRDVDEDRGGPVVRGALMSSSRGVGYLLLALALVRIGWRTTPWFVLGLGACMALFHIAAHTDLLQQTLFQVEPFGVLARNSGLLIDTLWTVVVVTTVIGLLSLRWSRAEPAGDPAAGYKNLHVPPDPAQR